MGEGWGGGRWSIQFDPPCGFSKNVSPKVMVKPCFVVTFNSFISLIFPEDFIEIPQFVQKIWRPSLSILAIFIDFLEFLIFPCYKESNDVSLYSFIKLTTFTKKPYYRCSTWFKKCLWLWLNPEIVYQRCSKNFLKINSIKDHQRICLHFKRILLAI